MRAGRERNLAAYTDCIIIALVCYEISCATAPDTLFNVLFLLGLPIWIFVIRLYDRCCRENHIRACGKTGT
jgi:hypothetical protein